MNVLVPCRIKCFTCVVKCAFKKYSNKQFYLCHISQNKCEDVFNSMPDKLKYSEVPKSAFITALEARGTITK